MADKPTAPAAKALTDMGATVDDLMFEDSTTLPRGRKARTVSEALEKALQDSAERKIAKIVKGSEAMVAGLLSDLGSAGVKRRYVITTETESLPGGQRKLVFVATAKSTE